MQREEKELVQRHRGVTQPACSGGAITVICPLRTGAEGTPPVGGSRGLDLVFLGVCLKAFIYLLLHSLPFHRCLE